MKLRRRTYVVVVLGSLGMLALAAPPTRQDDSQGTISEFNPGPTARSTSPWIDVNNGLKYSAGNVGIGTSPGKKKLLDVRSTTSGQFAAYFDSAGNNGADVAIKDGVFVLDEGGKNNLIIMKRANQASGQLRVNGSGSSTLFHGAKTGNAAVQLPAGSLSSPEIMDEPGAVNIRSAAVSPPSGGFGPIRSVTINAPANGFVLVLASGELEITHTNGDAETTVTFGVSKSANSVNSFQDTDIRIPSGAGTGTWDNGFSAHGLFSVNAGANTFFLVAAMFGPGSSGMNDIQVTAVFFPTAYGTIDPNTPNPNDPPAFVSDQLIRPSGPMTPHEIAAERVTSIQADLNRQQAELAQIQAKLEATIRELDLMEGR